jgi:hypothetical protein
LEITCGNLLAHTADHVYEPSPKATPKPTLQLSNPQTSSKMSGSSQQPGGPPTGGPPPEALGPVIDRGGSIVAIVWVEAVIASIFIILRFVSRRMGKTIGLDDWTMLIATV